MNYKVLAKYGQSVAFGVGALLTIVFFLIILASGLDAALNFFIWAAILIFFLTVFALVGFALYQIIIDTKGSSRGLMATGALLLVFLILFLVAEPDTSGKLAELRETNNISDNLMKGISSGILTTGVLAVAGFGAFLYFEVRNLFK